MSPAGGAAAIVLVDGGFMTGADMVARGMPVLSGRDEPAAWIRSNGLRFADWGSAVRQLAEMVGAEATPSFEAYVRGVRRGRRGGARRGRHPGG